MAAEREGLSPEIVERSELNWRVEHREKVESLNAAIAGSIVMKEIFDARRKPELGTSAELLDPAER